MSGHNTYVPQQVIIPKWLDQIPGVDYSPEKQLLTELEDWAIEQGWNVSDGSSLPLELRQRTDVLMEEPEGKKRIRVAVLRKKGKQGTIRLDASTFRTLELVYRPHARKWRLEVSSVPIAEDIQQKGWNYVADLAFAK